MSGAVRRAFCEAVNLNTGISCRPYYEQGTRPGDAFVRLDVANRDETGFDYMNTWQVCVVLDQGLADAEKRIDRILPGLLDALDPEGYVSSAQPVQLVVDTGTLPALVITVIRAQE